MAMDEAPLVREEARHLIKLGAKAAQERPDLVQSILQAWPGNEPLQQLRRQMAILLLFIKEGPAGPHTAPGGTLGMALQEIAYDAYFEFKNKLPPGTGVLRQLADAESNRDPGYLQYGKDSTVKRSVSLAGAGCGRVASLVGRLTQSGERSVACLVVLPAGLCCLLTYRMCNACSLRNAWPW